MLDARGVARGPGPAAVALAATGRFVLCAVPSGVWIDEHGGATGAVEWLLRTGAIVSAVVATAAWLVVLWRLGRRVPNRWAGRALGLVACLALRLPRRSPSRIRDLPHAPAGSPRPA